MRVPRVTIPGAAAGRSLELEGEAFHHLVRVLRRQVGDPLLALDGRGGAFRAQVKSLDPDRGVLTVEVGDPSPIPLSRLPTLAVAVGIPRGDGLEVAIRWGSELGLVRLIPLLTRRGTVKIPGEGGGGREGKKLARWQRIARESAEQCKRPVPLDVTPPISLVDLLRGLGSYRSAWIALPGANGLESSGFLETLRDASEEEHRPALVLVGPEGGFEPEEVQAALASGVGPVGFPTNVLKVPTAVVYLAAVASVSAG